MTGHNLGYCWSQIYAHFWFNFSSCLMVAQNAGHSIKGAGIPFGLVSKLGHFRSPQFTQLNKLISGYRQCGNVIE